jgi:hypothetical protein
LSPATGTRRRPDYSFAGQIVEGLVEGLNRKDAVNIFGRGVRGDTIVHLIGPMAARMHDALPDLRDERMRDGSVLSATEDPTKLSEPKAGVQDFADEIVRRLYSKFTAHSLAERVEILSQLRLVLGRYALEDLEELQRRRDRDNRSSPRQRKEAN